MGRALLTVLAFLFVFNYSDKDSGRCSLGGSSGSSNGSVSGRSTPNINSGLKTTLVVNGGHGPASSQSKLVKEKFKSLGSLQIEPALPLTPM